nr:MAG TPA: antitoxin [Caudoviricetes sp.]
MKDNGINRSELARAVGVTPEYVSMVLNRRRTPTGAEETFRSAIQRLITQKEDNAHD